MSEKNFDLVVIGGGPGGYIAAIRAVQLGFKVACIEKRGTLGGTCLNVGCVPSKALLQSSHHFETASHTFKTHGIHVNPKLDLAAMMRRKEKVVSDLTKGIEFLFKKNKITYIKGTAKIVSPNRIEIDGDGVQALKTKNILIATGSDVAPLPGVKIDERRIVSSTGALNLTKVPKSLIIIGGGVIGLELGSVWRRLGAEVTIIEFLDTILSGMDAEICKAMTRILEKQGMKFKLAHKVVNAKMTKNNVILGVEPCNDGKIEQIKTDVVQVSVGRLPYTEGLGLENVDVFTDKRGFIQVDQHFQTNISSIFAIGDVIGGAMLAHKAEEEGIAVAELLAGEAGHVNYNTIPSIVYTSPEIASVGQTEEQLKADNLAYKTGKFPIISNARARCNAETDGFVKILSDAKNDKILGAHIIASAASEIIQEVVLCMEFGGSAEDIARTCHAHPSLLEAIREAALDVDGRTIHM